MSSFGPNEVRIGAAVHRAQAHLATSCELYGSGRKPDALLQAARPATDVLPWLEVELRRRDAELREFFAATAQIGASIRRNDKPRSLRKALRKVEKTAADLLAAALGDAATDPAPAFRASVAIALLADVPNEYRVGVETGDLGAYQSAYALANWATDVLSESHDGRIDAVNKLVRSLATAFPGPEPPVQLVQPGDVERLIEELTVAATAELGAIGAGGNLDDALRRVDHLLEDVVDNYERGLGPLAARLAASLFVRSFDPVREELAAVDPAREARLTELIGVRLRRAINDNASEQEVRSIAAEARGLLNG